MGNALLVLATIFPVFFIIAIGFLIGKRKSFDIRPFTDLIVYIAAPCLIFTSMLKSTLSAGDFFTIAVATSLIILIQGILAFIYAKKFKKIGLCIPSVIGNTGYIGYPVSLFAFGATGLSIAIIYDIITSLFLYSIGISLLHQKNGWKEMLKVPLLYAVILGIVFNLSHISIPSSLFRSLEMVGAITIPLALLLLGCQLTKIRLTFLSSPLKVSLYKMFGGFAIAYLVLQFLGIIGITRTIILLQAAMPSAVMSMILTQKYNRDPEIVSSVVFLSTLIGIITIPLILFFFA